MAPTLCAFAMIARASHAHGISVDDPEALKPALEQALEKVHSGICAVVDVKIE